MVPESHDHEHVADDVVARHLGGPATRRTFVLGTLAFLAGCSTAGRTDQLPGIVWTDPAAAPRGDVTAARPRMAARGNVISRSAWAKGGCIPSNMNRMQPVQRITIHHDGMDSFTTTSQSAASARLERIRRGHLARGAWGDIGYHYAIDRGGRVWECRDLRYQGAHVKGRNEGNIGILVMGNFDVGRPSSAQLRSLASQVSALCAAHGISKTSRGVRSHKEWSSASTLCPGRNLQPEFVKLRDRGFRA